jgi:hypothetical protein
MAELRQGDSLGVPILLVLQAEITLIAAKTRRMTHRWSFLY